MDNKNRKSEYVDEIYKVIPITKKNEIRVLTSTESVSGSVLVDIRKYALYGGNKQDNIKRPTEKGIKFKLFNAKEIIFGLLDILVAYSCLDHSVSCNVKIMLNRSIKM